MTQSMESKIKMCRAWNQTGQDKMFEMMIELAAENAALRAELEHQRKWLARVSENLDEDATHAYQVTGELWAAIDAIRPRFQ